MENYRNQININTSASRLFEALTTEIPFWWTKMFEGSAHQEGNRFTVYFGESVFKKMNVMELVQDRKVVWFVEDSMINIPELTNKKEWIGTTIIWEMEQDNTGIHLHLTHVGLNPGFECYEICSLGWKEFTRSLRSYLETGEGMPYTPLPK